MQVQYASWMEKILSLNWSYFILLLTRHCLLLPNQRWSVVRVLPLQQSSPVSKALTAWEGIRCVRGLGEAPLTQISGGDLHGMSSGTAVLAAGSGWGKQFAIWAHQVLLGAVLLVRRLLHFSWSRSSYTRECTAMYLAALILYTMPLFLRAE